MIAEWVSDEFSSIDLGDKRLDSRLKQSVTAVSKVGESTPDNCLQGGELKGMYRLVDNAKVDCQRILQEHQCSTIRRCGEEDLVYLLSDTTEVDLTKPKIVVQGAGPIGAGTRRGFYFHPSYAVNQDGTPLGMIDHIIWARPYDSLELTAKEKRSRKSQACFEEKETWRWLEIQQNNEQLARSVPTTNFVMVADSEADISELLSQSDDFPENFDIIIRGCHNHRLINTQADEQATTGQATENSKVNEALRATAVLFEIPVDVPARPKPITPADKKRRRRQQRSAHRAILSVRTARLTLAGIGRPGNTSLKPSALNVVELYEENPPESDVPIRWVLFTTLPIDTEKQIKAVIDGYIKRWLVELYFKTLKSGLKIEEMKYRTLKRYLAAFAISCVVAWRIEYLKAAARNDPQAPCRKYFTDQEWVPIFVFMEKRQADIEHPPTISQFITLIARLGGYINKKSQGPPGSKTIWRGIKRSDAIVQAFQIFNDVRCGV